ncbi:MAG: outer membrane lipoprotein-sorting protein [Desulfobacteraceae bacterium]|nr:outer membrane lipoprotein-sorting protein [Desulfobacteraceae bacterium]MBC2754233.1 outer membrane lipoprotein-sorting protein [Desulfobacteraceae bacterium]
MNIIFRFIGLTLLITFLIPVSFAIAEDEKAREIMQNVDDRDDGDNQTSNMLMTLIDKHNKERIRKLSLFSKDKGEDTLRLMFFIHPADVKDTSFLTYDYDDPDKDDDQWLYLPALKKTKRIASSDKSDSFMGSDLNYSDMTSRNLEDYDFFLKKEIQVRGKDAWVVESIPRSKDIIDETGYSKSLLIVQKDIYFVVRAVNWEKTGGYVKYMDVVTLEQIDGIWVGTEMHVAKKKGKQTVHKTILKFNNVKFNQGLEEDLFTVRRMEKGL